ncbi:MAG: PIG-L family deacetylase [Pyrinomonadaceae bacterium]
MTRSKKTRQRGTVLLLLVVLTLSNLFFVSPPARAQVRPTYDYGALGLGQLLRGLQTTGSVMLTGAHPDDEDSALLAYMARGLPARTAYLSLTRGDGGQNVLGSEQSESLGVIRTEELLQARRLDGAEQYFTRAFDYGFSKSLDEAKSKWPEQLILGDMVRAIRIFRPLVLISRFSGTSADGHGQHQFAGYLTPRAVVAAADPNQFPEQIRAGLPAWKVRKFYVSSNPRNQTDPPTLRFDTGRYDPLLGRSYAEIAAEGRSLHRTQEQGNLENRGPRYSGVRLVQGVETWKGPDTSLFTAIDTSISGLGTQVGVTDEAFRFELVRTEVAAKRALNEYDPFEPQKIIPALADGLNAVRKGRTRLKALSASSAREDADFFLSAKEAEFTEALRRVAGIEIDVIADRETVVPGDTLTVSMQVSNPQLDNVQRIGMNVINPTGWTTVPKPNSANSQVVPATGETEVLQFETKLVAGSALKPTEPFWLTSPRDHDLFRWPDPLTPWSKRDPLCFPFLPAEIYGEAEFKIGGEIVRFERPIQYRFADAVRGELRRDVNVVPALSLELDQDLLIVPSGTAAKPQRLVVVATNNADRPITSQVQLQLPAGWSAAPSTVPLSFKRRGDRLTAVFTVTPRGRPAAGSYPIIAVATADGQKYDQEMHVLSYPHIQTHRIYAPAAATVNVFDLKVAPVRVGYIMGAGDEVPDAIRRMGVPVTMLSESDLAAGDLSQFETIVVGIKATDTRPDFVANHERLLDFARAGGTLIVQYQRPTYATLKLPPFATQMGPRISDENAPVTILKPEDPLFNWPNKITALDFDGWVQERSLYGFTEFGASYTPVLETHDEGEPAQNGGEVMVPMGRGLYIYTAFAWFRQLPHGVPGAYRLFANMLSRGKAAAGGGPRAK